jgi:hypothetical protein
MPFTDRTPFLGGGNPHLSQEIRVELEGDVGLHDAQQCST